MGGACGTYGGDETFMQGGGGETSKRKEHLLDRGVGKRIILKRILKKLRCSSWAGLIWLGTGRNGGLL
jgi:hypothetical protein